MKKQVKVIIIFLILYFSLSAAVQTPLAQSENLGGMKAIEFNQKEPTPIEDDSFPNYDQYILSRKLDQKALEPLTKKERVIWAYRMADKNALL